MSVTYISTARRRAWPMLCNGPCRAVDKPARQLGPQEITTHMRRLLVENGWATRQGGWVTLTEAGWRIAASESPEVCKPLHLVRLQTRERAARDQREAHYSHIEALTARRRREDAELKEAAFALDRGPEPPPAQTAAIERMYRERALRAMGSFDYGHKMQPDRRSKLTKRVDQ